MKSFNYNTVNQSNSVVVLAGGYSSGIYIESVRSYVKKNNSVVFVANYNYGVSANYTYFGDYTVFTSQAKKIKSSIVVPRSLKGIAKSYLNKIKREIYLVRHCGTANIYHSDRVKFLEDGSLPYKNLATSGLACIVLSLLCRPTKMLLVGFDGPSSDPKAKTKKKFDGSVVKYKKPGKRKKEMSYLQKSLFPTLHDRKIIIETFENVLFYGLSKKSLGLKVL